MKIKVEIEVDIQDVLRQLTDKQIVAELIELCCKETGEGFHLEKAIIEAMQKFIKDNT
jgi:hypothetical protein